MIITDQKAQREIRVVNFFRLTEDIQNYPEDERDGRSDLQFLADEESYLLSCFEEDGHTLQLDLEEAYDVYRHSDEHRESELKWAHDTIKAYRRLCHSYARLKDLGYKGKWY